VRHLHLVSLLMTVVGLALVVFAVAGWLNPTLLVVGLFLLWAGIVKVVVVALWRHLGGPQTNPPVERGR
jgi:hypothetical protein